MPTTPAEVDLVIAIARLRHRSRSTVEAKGERAGTTKANHYVERVKGEEGEGGVEVLIISTQSWVRNAPFGRTGNQRKILSSPSFTAKTGLTVERTGGVVLFVVVVVVVVSCRVVVVAATRVVVEVVVEGGCVVVVSTASL